MFTVAFDVDGTLIDYDGTPRHEVIDLLRAFRTLGASVHVWSGGGDDYARQRVKSLGLVPYVHSISAKNMHMRPDIAIDDEKVTLGKTNFQVTPGLIFRSEIQQFLGLIDGSSDGRDLGSKDT
jgi:hypothetical protein